MLLDCTTCPGRPTACSECMVAVLLDPLPRMDPEVATAVAVLRDAGLIGALHLALIPEPEPARPRLRVIAGQRRAG